MAKKRSTKKKTSSRRGSSARGASRAAPDATNKHLVIVESPTKAKTINRYLGPGYVVMASVGHVRDLPKSAPKGSKRDEHPVPGVDLEHDFEPTYEILPDKKKTISQLKKAAKQASDVWFATDLDREGEAIAWHLARALDIPERDAKRVVFNAITKGEIGRAFEQPRNIDLSKVDAQQARRILDRIVGYQVSPLLWKKVAGGLSAGRVQSVATRLVVEREREIEAFIPDEFWKVTGYFATRPAEAAKLAQAWSQWLAQAEDGRTIKDQNAWLSEHQCLRAELVEVAGKPFKVDNRDEALRIARNLGFDLQKTDEQEDAKAKGPAKHLVRFHGGVAQDAPDYQIRSIETKRTKSRPNPPFITSTMQQAAANRLGFQLQRTMRIAQQLYEGIDLKGNRGQTGLITYMRTDSTHLSSEAIDQVRNYIDGKIGGEYLPEKPNFYKTKSAGAQEAHEAIRPTDVSITPASIRSVLSDEQYKLYDLIWRRFVACQMTPAEWDSTTILIAAEPPEAAEAVVFKATGRTLVFDGHLKVMGVPTSDDVVLPRLEERQPVGPIDLSPTQHFTSPPPRYTEASLQKKLEEEGIGRPSTYASIIGTIQDRKYVETVSPRDRRLMATDLGQVVTDKLAEAFPRIMDIPYTREMEAQLDEIEDQRADWRQMLRDFYGPFKAKLEKAHEQMTHAKAETQPAPYACPQCGSATCYRFGKNGKFLSCTAYPDCKYAAPIDREGKPQEPELTDVLCPEDGARMILRKGRFGPFLASSNYPEVKYIIKLDPKKGSVVLPKTPPMETDVICPKCEEANLLMRESKRGPWLSCSRFPKCRGRQGFDKLEEAKQKQLEEAWSKWVAEHPTPEIRTVSGHVISEEEDYVPLVAGSEPAGSIDADADTAAHDAA